MCPWNAMCGAWELPAWNWLIPEILLKRPAPPRSAGSTAARAQAAGAEALEQELAAFRDEVLAVAEDGAVDATDLQLVTQVRADRAYGVLVLVVPLARSRRGPVTVN